MNCGIGQMKETLFARLLVYASREMAIPWNILDHAAALPDVIYPEGITISIFSSFVVLKEATMSFSSHP